MTMNSVTISLIVFACVIGGALIGLLLGKVLPPNHLSGDSKDVVKVGMGLVGTMTAILLGLLVASAKSFYDPQNDAQHSLQTQALSIAIDLGKTRWLMFEQGSSSVSVPLLAALIFWLAVIFCSFGLLA